MKLVYGEIPRPVKIYTAETQQKRVEEVEKTMVTATKERTRRRIYFSVTHGGGLCAGEKSSERRRLLSEILSVCLEPPQNCGREYSSSSPLKERWRSSKQLEQRRIFRRTCLKPCIDSELHKLDEAYSKENDEYNSGTDDLTTPDIDAMLTTEATRHEFSE